MALNGRAELALDRAIAAGFPLRPCPGEQQTAAKLLRNAMSSFPANVTALMNAALLSRDEGDAERALQLWAQVVDEQLRSGSGSTKDETWSEDWVRAPRRRCAPLACLYRALLLSQLGRHTEATPELQRLGFRWRLAPAVWDCARLRPAAFAGPGTPASPAGARAAAKVAMQETSVPVAMYADAAPAGTHAALRRAFAPGAAYWRETRYESAAARKRYHTFYADADALRAPPATGVAHSNAIERLLRALLPLTGEDVAPSLRCCEWWVHQRVAGRSLGHELHYDCHEPTMEASGEVVHPRVSSVYYISGAGDPTLILDETLHNPCREASAAYVAHPRERAYLTFEGDRLHGVLPGLFAHAPSSAAGSTSRPSATSSVAAEARVTLLVAWYDRPLQRPTKRPRTGASARAAPASAVPRPSRAQTWPCDLELSAAEAAVDAAAPAAPAAGNVAAAAAVTARQLRVPSASPVWDRVPPREATRTSGKGRAPEAPSAPLLEPPCSVRQHFFLHRPCEVSERLREEHGIGGSWVGGEGQSV